MMIIEGICFSPFTTFVLNDIVVKSVVFHYSRIEEIKVKQCNT